jgi:hypothetical protein
MLLLNLWAAATCSHSNFATFDIFVFGRVPIKASFLLHPITRVTTHHRSAIAALVKQQKSDFVISHNERVVAVALCVNEKGHKRFLHRHLSSAQQSDWIEERNERESEQTSKIAEKVSQSSCRHHITVSQQQQREWKWLWIFSIYKIHSLIVIIVSTLKTENFFTKAHTHTHFEALSKQQQLMRCFERVDVREKKATWIALNNRKRA